MAPRTAEDLEVELAWVKLRLENSIKNWKHNRRQTVKVLRELAEEIQTDEDNSRIARLAGSSASIVGKHIALGGAVAAFFTFGASLILTIVGGVIVGAGESTILGTKIVNDLLPSRNIELVVDALQTDREESLRIQDQMDKAVEVTRRLNFLSGNDTQFSCGDMYLSRHRGGLGNDANELRRDVRQAMKFDGELDRDVFKTLESASKQSRVASVAFCAVSIVPNISTLVSTSVHLRNGSVLEVVQYIRDTAAKLEDAVGVFDGESWN